jgi:tetratricopeptide (TPR) repeat protein
MYQTDTMVSAVTTLAEAAQEGELTLKIAREIGHRSGEAFAMIGLALSLGSKGEYDRAIRLLQDSVAIAQEIDHRQWITYANIELGAVYLDVLAFPLAEQCLKQALALAQETHSLLGYSTRDFPFRP